jgi:large subunit ribosomal protein L30
MSKSSSGTIRIRWIRSGIAFNRNQKEIVRSLGLRRLHHVVERPDNPVVRGLVAKVAHLVEIVDGESRPASAVPEYSIKSVAAAESVAASEDVPAAQEHEPPADDLKTEGAEA